MSTLAVTPTTANTNPPGTPASGVVTAGSATQDQTMFLQLLVSELRNQDPLNPVQGTDFVTQLAQFQQLQQSITSGQDISAIHQDLDQIVADFSSASSTAGGASSGAGQS